MGRHSDEDSFPAPPSESNEHSEESRLLAGESFFSDQPRPVAAPVTGSTPVVDASKRRARSGSKPRVIPRSLPRQGAPADSGPPSRSLTQLRRWGRPAAGVVTVAAVAGLLALLGGTEASGAANVVANSEMDSDLAGWTVNEGTVLTQVPGRTGNAARISQNGPGPRTIVLNDARNSVAKTVAGTSYVAGAWIRSTRPNASVSLRIMEFDGRALRGQTKTSAWLTDLSWHRVSVTYVAQTSGASLDLNVVANRLPVGYGIDIDDVTLIDPNAKGGVVANPGPVPSTAGTAPATTKPAVTTAPAASPTVKPTKTKEPTATTAPATTKPAVPAAPAGWKLSWSDEFNDNSLDRSVWKAENNSTYGESNKELACLMDRPENLSESGGSLHFIARRESKPVKCGNNDSRFPNGRNFTSAHISSKNLKEWTYGRFEIRAKLPTAAGKSKGLWPAFWLRPTNGGTGELDVLEAVGGDGSKDANKVYQTIWYDYNGTHPKEAVAYTLPSGQLSDGMHTYATEWEPGAIRWYVDGKLSYSRTKSTTKWLDSAFNKPFYIRLNLAVGGNWPGTPSSSTVMPASYDVDYVRVYRR